MPRAHLDGTLYPAIVPYSRPSPEHHAHRSLRSTLACVIAGPLAGIITWWLLQDAVASQAISQVAARVAGVAVLMGIWWITEAVTIEVTGLVPLVAFPMLETSSFAAAANPYASAIIFLFLGGMVLGKALEVWHLHTRFALGVLTLFGSKPSSLVMGFLAASAFVSMWVSNTAATVMMLPIGVSVVGMLAAARAGHATPADADSAPQPPSTSPSVPSPHQDPFAIAIVLAIAFGASIGGVGTIIGTPPVSLYASFVERTTGTPVTFTQWLIIGVPTLLAIVPLCGVVLTRIAFRVSRERVPVLGRIVSERLAQLGPMNTPQRLLLVIFALAALGWITSTWTKVPDAVIAIAAAIALFVVPAFAPSGNPRALLTWREAERIPWGVLLLFGGGLSLAEAIDVSGLDDALANLGLGLDGIPLFLILLIIALVTIILTEFSNNTALVAAALPIGQSLAPALGVPPAVLLVTITLTASLGFAMPGGTAPNALAYSSGMVPMRSMVRAGLILDALVAIVVPVLVYAAYAMNILPGMHTPNP